MRRIFQSLVFTTTLVLMSSMARAEVADARRLFNQGVEFFANEQYEPALEAFSRSYDLNPIPTVLYNIAMCHRALDQAEASLERFRQYLDEVGDRISPQRRAEVDQLISEMAALVDQSDMPDALSQPEEEPLNDDAALAFEEEPGGLMPEENEGPAPEPPRPPIVRRWWFWTVIGSVLVASVVGVGLGLGLTRHQGEMVDGDWELTLR